MLAPLICQRYSPAMEGSGTLPRRYFSWLEDKRCDNSPRLNRSLSEIQALLSKEKGWSQKLPLLKTLGFCFLILCLYQIFFGYFHLHTLMPVFKKKIISHYLRKKVKPTAERAVAVNFHLKLALCLCPGLLQIF